MSGQNGIDYIVSRLSSGFGLADEEQRQPTVVMKFVSPQDLAKEVGQDALGRLIWLVGSGHQKGNEFPLIVLQVGDRSLNVAVTDPEAVSGLEKASILPSLEELAKLSAGLVQYIVLTGQNALFVLSQEASKTMGGEALQSAIRLGAYLRPRSVLFVDKRRFILTWYEWY
jgi:hypothetical protein